MTRTFVDTNAWFALADGRARGHADVAAWLGGFRGRIVTSTDVFDETITLIQSRLGHHAAVSVGRRLQDPAEVELVAVTPDDRERAWQLFEARPDKGYSLTDCTSFVLMQRLGIDAAATLDEHFRREGFRTIP